MGAYLIRRVLLIPPKLLIVMALNFAVVQFIPGGPVEHILSQLDDPRIGATSRLTGGTGDVAGQSGDDGNSPGCYRGSRGLDADFIASSEKQFGFDKPPLERFWLMLGKYIRFDFATSYFTGRPVLHLVIEKLPVLISLGLSVTLLIYLISIPLGIIKALRDGTRFEAMTSVAIIAGAAPFHLFCSLSC